MFPSFRRVLGPSQKNSRFLQADQTAEELFSAGRGSRLPDRKGNQSESRKKGDKRQRFWMKPKQVTAPRRTNNPQWPRWLMAAHMRLFLERNFSWTSISKAKRGNVCHWLHHFSGFSERRFELWFVLGKDGAALLTLTLTLALELKEDWQHKVPELLLTLQAYHPFIC